MESQQLGRTPYFYGPEGALVQVDFALEAVNRGSTTVGIRTNEHAILASYLKPTRPLLDPAEKIYQIDQHLGATGAGYIGDVMKLIQELRVNSQKHRLTFDSPIDVKTASEDLSAYLHQYTIYAVRPLGASVIITGKDPTGVQMYQIDPSGTYFRGSGFSIGAGSDRSIEIIQNGYRPNLSLEETVKLAKEAIKSATKDDNQVELGVVSNSSSRFEKINQVQVPSSAQ